jgi:hypothetical protein
MNHSKIHLEEGGTSARQFRSAVSLHSHTLHSHETLTFINRLARRIGPIGAALEGGKAKYESLHGSSLDLRRAWWTPPLAPRDAWAVEKQQIECRLGVKALISLTDHDDIEAPLSLRVLEECRDIPISVEWTVPYGPTFFHLGVHNLASDQARGIMSALARFTSRERPGDLACLLHALVERKATLIVFNHPCWDENGIGHEAHVRVATHFIRQYGQSIHALELNGLRPWAENREVFQMAREVGKPLISGGDRHALEANTILDLTNAATFSEYVEHVRAGRTDVLVTDQYREPYAMRILQNIEEILQDYENHGRGWKHWSDRVFYTCDDGIARSLTTLCENRMPASIQFFVRAIKLVRRHRVRQTFRLAFPRRQELAL